LAAYGWTRVKCGGDISREAPALVEIQAFGKRPAPAATKAGATAGTSSLGECVRKDEANDPFASWNIEGK
jgi:hypothetical protein